LIGPYWRNRETGLSENTFYRWKKRYLGTFPVDLLTVDYERPDSAVGGISPRMVKHPAA
jgi:hypothetical protein